MNTHILITMSGTEHKLNEQDKIDISRAQTGQLLSLSSGQIVNTSTIASILTMSKYYEEHPDKRPEAESACIESRQTKIDFKRRDKVINKLKKNLANKGIIKSM